MKTRTTLAAKLTIRTGVKAGAKPAVCSACKVND